MEPSDRIKRMTAVTIDIEPVRLRDLFAVTRLTHENMLGADREFTRLVSSPTGRWISYLALPINLLSSGSGYKAVIQGKMIGCAYLNLGLRSGYVFNVLVQSQYRRQGTGSMLMKHLEDITRENGRYWMALQVDDSNRAARGLYEELGYTAYHPEFFGGVARALDFREISGTLQIDRLSAVSGRNLFGRYLKIERANGDSWASHIVNDLIPIPTVTGEYFSCLVQNEVVGCIQRVRKRDQLRLELVLNPEQWGNWLALGAISTLLSDFINPRTVVEINLGSSEHHQALQPLLESFGLLERISSRFFMLKQTG
jgi:ribosomal protein S18 acetylase RimI-like enzyme